MERFANEPLDADMVAKCEPVEANHVQVGDVLPYGGNTYTVTDIVLRKEQDMRYHYVLRLIGYLPDDQECDRTSWSDASFGAKLWRIKKTLDRKPRKR